MDARPLITPNQADKILAKHPHRPIGHSLLIVLLGLLMVVAFTLMVLILLSLRANTGLSSIFPWLTKSSAGQLQL